MEPEISPSECDPGDEKVNSASSPSKDKVGVSRVGPGGVAGSCNVVLGGTNGARRE